MSYRLASMGTASYYPVSVGTISMLGTVGGYYYEEYKPPKIYSLLHLLLVKRRSFRKLYGF